MTPLRERMTEALELRGRFAEDSQYLHRLRGAILRDFGKNPEQLGGRRSAYVSSVPGSRT